MSFEASRLLKDDAAVHPWAECESGGYASVSGFGLHEPPDTVVARMRRFGDAQEVKSTECLDHLGPSACGQTWRYTPDDGNQTYVVEMPLRENSGEFAMAVEH